MRSTAIMRVAVSTSFAADRREPLGTLVERVHNAFLEAGQGEPVVQFALSDSAVGGFVSSVDRVLKRFPEMVRFAVTSPASPLGGPLAAPVKQIGNHVGSPAAGEAAPFATLLAIATGVPRSFPFHNVTLRFSSPAFGRVPPGPGLESLSMADRQRLFDVRGLVPGIVIGDSWWVNHRQRQLSALTIVEADPASKKLPALPEPVSAMLAACGKAKKTMQVPLPEAAPAAPMPKTSAPAPDTGHPSPERLAAVRQIVLDYRQHLDETLERAGLPHDLPDNREATEATPPGRISGPLKPALARTFATFGYDCRGDTGSFTLRRRTAGNLAVAIHFDTGTWFPFVLGFFKVEGLGFKAVHSLPVSRRAAVNGQYPIGDAARWQQIVENLAALVTELDRSFVPAIERAAGPSPAWYRPES
jgi:hypothetical protein